MGADSEPRMNKVMPVERGSLLSAREVRAGSQVGPCELGIEGRVGVGIVERDTPSAEQHSTNKGQHSVPLRRRWGGHGQSDHHYAQKMPRLSFSKTH